MRRVRALVPSIMGCFLAGMAWGAEIEDRVNGLAGADDATRWTEMNRIARLGAAAVPGLFQSMGGENAELDKAARMTVEMLVNYASRPGAGPEQEAVENALLEVAQSDRPADQRILALRMLGLAGGEASVPVLALLLRDEALAETARRTLARIPGPESTQAVLAALPGAAGALKAGLIQVLAERGEAAALGGIRLALADRNRDVRVAAVEALGKVGEAEDGDRLYEVMARGEGFEQSRAARAYAGLADSLSQRGEKITAYLMYQRLVSRVGLPKEARIAGLVGIGRSGGDEAVPILIEAVMSHDEDLRSAAQAGLTALLHADPNLAISAAFPVAPVPSQRLLIQVLRERREKEGRAILIQALAAQDPVVRSEALAALATFGNPEDVVHLVRALGQPARVGDAARRNLAAMRGTEVTRKIGDLCRDQALPNRLILLEVLGERRDAGAFPTLLQAVVDPESGIRVAAARSLAMLAEEETIPSLANLLDPRLERDQRVRERILAGLGPVRAAPVSVPRVAGGRDGALVALLPRLGTGEAALLEEYAREHSPAVQAVALAGLAAASPESSLPLFQEALRSRESDVRAEGVRGMAMLAMRVAVEDPGRALAIADEAFRVAAAAGQKALVVKAIGRTRSPAAVRRLMPLFESAELREEVCAAAMVLASAVQDADRDAAVELLRKAGRHTCEPDLAAEAVERLGELGELVDLADFGYVARYWVSGPFAGREALRELEASPADGAVDLRSAWEVLGESHAWREVDVRSPDGFVDLTQLLGENEDCGAFLYAEIESPRKRAARLLLGSDDDLYVWLNGERIFEHVGNRGYSLGPDGVEVTLRKGRNALVMKVLQGKGGWGCGARVVDAP